MPLKYNGTQPTIINYNGISLTDVKYGSTVVWRKRTVTYYSETNSTKTATFIEGQAISLSSSYATAKSGYRFIGWRQDRSASSSVLNSLTMSSSNVSLYAVYRKTITVTYYNNSTSAASTRGYQYYNTGNVTNPSFKLTQSSRTGWNVRGWSTSTAANGSITYNNGASFTRNSNVTLYGMYQKTVTVSYNGNGATSGSTAAQSGTAYYNSNGNIINPSFTLRSNGFSRTNYKFINWRQGSTSGTARNPGTSIRLSSNTTFYASWEEMYKAVEVRYQNSHTLTKEVWRIFPDNTISGENWTPTIPAGSCISFTGRYSEVIANCNCTVTFSTERAYQGYGSANANQWRYYSADGGSACRTSLFLNDTENTYLVYSGCDYAGHEHYFSWSKSINLTTGQRASIRNLGGKANDNNRLGIWGTLVIKATRR